MSPRREIIPIERIPVGPIRIAVAPPAPAPGRLQRPPHDNPTAYITTRRGGNTAITVNNRNNSRR
ncbi:hypothetical protein JYU34_011825 [Plutella xylostella]|uniref:Uncharacterized protein n=1 Tax=Plutella xylostella TaxID=51655 RepID=A0ABQ7QDM0_PLUXY|nr:hypothetical protein JYU34_011825 [Plutella xylostella]